MERWSWKLLSCKEMIIPSIRETLHCRAWTSHKYGGVEGLCIRRAVLRSSFVYNMFTSVDCSSDFFLVGRDTEVQVNLCVNPNQIFPRL